MTQAEQYKMSLSWMDGAARPPFEQPVKGSAEEITLVMGKYWVPSYVFADGSSYTNWQAIPHYSRKSATRKAESRIKAGL